MQTNDFYASHLQQAVALHQQGEHVKAEAAYQTLFSSFGPRPELFQAMGTMYVQRGATGFGAFLLEQGIERGYQRFEAYHNLGNAYRADNRMAEAEGAFARAFETSETDEHRADSLVAQSTLYVNAGDPQKCVDLCNRALELVPDHRFALWNRCIAYLELGMWKEGFYWYDEAGFREDQGKARDRKLRTYGDKPAWTPGRHSRKATVVVYGEQGIGDEIMFGTMIPDLIAKSGRVIIDCDKRLKDLFATAFPECTIRATSGEEPAWIADDPPDYRIAMGSLGRWFRRKDGDFPKQPYLKADPQRVAYWKAELAKIEGRKIGISWVGGLKQTRADLRSIPLPFWRPLADRGALVSLQYHKWAADEAAQTGNLWELPVHHWQDAIDDYNETAALCCALDLVVTVNTSLLHLCGALGVQTVCLTPSAPAWRYGLKGENPFYGSVRTVRQAKGEDWQSVIERVAATC